MGGTNYRGYRWRTIPADQAGDRIRVDGRYIGFTVRSRDFAALNYSLSILILRPHL